MILAIYNCIWTPLTISFDWAMKKEDVEALKTINYIILIIYSIDILVQFFTSYFLVQTGDEIRKPSKFAKRYMLSFEFLIDILSTFPFREIEVESEGYKAFSQLV